MLEVTLGEYFLVHCILFPKMLLFVIKEPSVQLAFDSLGLEYKTFKYLINVMQLKHWKQLYFQNMSINKKIEILWKGLIKKML
jgi:hypothetical protein